MPGKQQRAKPCLLTNLRRVRAIFLKHVGESTGLLHLRGMERILRDSLCAAFCRTCSDMGSPQAVRELLRHLQPLSCPPSRTWLLTGLLLTRLSSPLAARLAFSPFFCMFSQRHQQALLCPARGWFHSGSRTIWNHSEQSGTIRNQLEVARSFWNHTEPTRHVASTLPQTPVQTHNKEKIQAKGHFLGSS